MSDAVEIVEDGKIAECEIAETWDVSKPLEDAIEEQKANTNVIEVPCEKKKQALIQEDDLPVAQEVEPLQIDQVSEKIIEDEDDIVFVEQRDKP